MASFRQRIRRTAQLSRQSSTTGNEFCDAVPKDKEFDLGDATRPLKVDGDKVRELCTKFKKFDEDRVYWHYSTWANCIRWGLQEHINKGEVDYLASQHSGQAAGGGVYMAGNSQTSRNYGNCCVMIKQKKGTPIYDQTLTRSVLGVSLSHPQKAKLGQLIPFMHHSNTASDWWVTHHHMCTREVSAMTPDPSDASKANFVVKNGQKVKTFEEAATPWKWDQIKKDSDLFKLLHKSQSGKWMSFQDGAEQVNGGLRQVWNDAVGYITSVFALMRYMDGISFVRAVHTSPGNPWGEFEPHNFEPFKKMLTKYQYMKHETGKLGDFTFSHRQSNVGYVGPSNANRVEWAKAAVKRLKELYQEVGPPKRYPRDEEVRAGGDLEGKNFRVTPGLAKAMQANPYLEVYLSAMENNGIKAHYYYPDPAHSSKLVTTEGGKYLKPRDAKADKPNALIEEIQSKTYEEWAKAKESPEFKALTIKMQERLLENMFHDACSKYISRDLTWRGIVGIHPSPDFNGRVNRLWQYLESLDSNEDPPFHFIADFDLMTPEAQYAKFLGQATRLFHALRAKMLAKMIHVLFTKKRKANGSDYWTLPELQGLMQSLQPIAGGNSFKAFTWPPEGTQLGEWWEIIRVRDWVLFLNKLFGEGKWNWSYPNPSVKLDMDKH